MPLLHGTDPVNLARDRAPDHRMTGARVGRLRRTLSGVLKGRYLPMAGKGVILLIHLDEGRGALLLRVTGPLLDHRGDQFPPAPGNGDPGTVLRTVASGKRPPRSWPPRKNPGTGRGRRDGVIPRRRRRKRGTSRLRPIPNGENEIRPLRILSGELVVVQKLPWMMKMRMRRMILQRMVALSPDDQKRFPKMCRLPRWNWRTHGHSSSSCRRSEEKK